MKKLIFLIIITLILLFFSIGIFRTSQIRNSPNQQIFEKGYISLVIPDGYYKGQLFLPYELTDEWRGKKFDSKSGTGINVFNNDLLSQERNKFSFKKTSSVSDNLQVIKLEYDFPENKWWVRLTFEEIVQIGEDKFLGKLYFQLIPQVPFAISYFTLEK